MLVLPALAPSPVAGSAAYADRDDFPPRVDPARRRSIGTCVQRGIRLHPAAATGMRAAPEVAGCCDSASVGLPRRPQRSPTRPPAAGGSSPFRLPAGAAVSCGASSSEATLRPLDRGPGSRPGRGARGRSPRPQRAGRATRGRPPHGADRSGGRRCGGDLCRRRSGHPMARDRNWSRSTTRSPRCWGPVRSPERRS